MTDPQWPQWTSEIKDPDFYKRPATIEEIISLILPVKEPVWFTAYDWNFYLRSSRWEPKDGKGSLEHIIALNQFGFYKLVLMGIDEDKIPEAKRRPPYKNRQTNTPPTLIGSAAFYPELGTFFNLYEMQHSIEIPYEEPMNAQVTIEFEPNLYNGERRGHVERGDIKHIIKLIWVRPSTNQKSSARFEWEVIGKGWSFNKDGWSPYETQGFMDEDEAMFDVRRWLERLNNNPAMQEILLGSTISANRTVII